MLDSSRRQFLRAALFVAAAPVIVRASSLMDLRGRPLLVRWQSWSFSEGLPRYGLWTSEYAYGMGTLSYARDFQKLSGLRLYMEPI